MIAHRARPPLHVQGALLALLLVAGSAAGIQQASERTPRPFRHVTHEAMECTECHRTRAEPGRVMIPSQADCQRCHHAPRFAESCARCHDPATQATASVTRPFRVAGGATTTRLLPFSHAQHTTLACAACHASSAPFAATVATCADCHADHHSPEADCMACHMPPREGAHQRADHLTCTGAGCHDAAQIGATPARTRQECLSCHRDQAGHIPGRACVDCHVLPRRIGATHGRTPP